MKKVIVYGETERQARKFYPARQGVKVAYRLLKDNNQGDETKADEIVYACKKPEAKFKTAKKK